MRKVASSLAHESRIVVKSSERARKPLGMHNIASLFEIYLQVLSRRLKGFE